MKIIQPMKQASHRITFTNGVKDCSAAEALDIIVYDRSGVSMTLDVRASHIPSRLSPSYSRCLASCFPMGVK
jgi:hypothetical protein